MITRAIASTPTAGMEILLKIPPLDCFLTGSAISTSIRLRKTNHWATIPQRKKLGRDSHVRILDEIVNENPQLIQPQDKLHKNSEWRPATIKK